MRPFYALKRISSDKKGLLFQSLVLGIALLLTAGCGRSKETRYGPFAPYVAEFEAASIEANRPMIVDDLIIEFGPEEDFDVNQEARCIQKEGATPVIQVNPTRWANLDSNQRSFLMIHEKGHCVLKRDHVQTIHLSEDRLEWVPDSMMYPYMLKGDHYARHRSELIQELFRNAP